jgi:cytochrome d ubiquinol oxidase subunit II
MEILWFVLVTFTLIAYVVLDGFDLGVGIVMPAVAHNDDERTALLDTIKPVWDGNEVWLVGAAGSLYFAFPLVYASSFSGFYLPLTIVLWLLILRALGIELRTHVREPVWWPLFDVLFAGASVLLAIVFGVAAGNVVRGVPLDADGYFFEPLWTDFRVGSHAGVLDWYTALIGLLSLVTLTVHGSCYVALKTAGAIQARVHAVAALASVALVGMTLVSLAATIYVRPAVLANFGRHPSGWAIPVVVVVALASVMVSAARGRAGAAFAASAVYIVAMLGGAAFALYPMLLPASTNPSYSLTIFNARTGAYSMTVGLIWWGIGIALATIYFIVLYRSFRGTIVPSAERAG